MVLYKHHFLMTTGWIWSQWVAASRHTDFNGRKSNCEIHKWLHDVTLKYDNQTSAAIWSFFSNNCTVCCAALWNKLYRAQVNRQSRPAWFLKHRPFVTRPSSSIKITHKGTGEYLSVCLSLTNTLWTVVSDCNIHIYIYICTHSHPLTTT